jgi:DNA-binding SARP family transcriptional activator/transcriptional regulator with XRE-family HTH domain/tetratricopeptide (TPR) repeat protein
MSTSRGAVGNAGRLRRLRMAAGLGQRELAELAGISERTVRALERGGVGRPHAASVQRLAAALGVGVDRLLSALDEDAAAGRADAGDAANTGEAPRATVEQVLARPRVEILGPPVLRRGRHVGGAGSTLQSTLLGLLAAQPRQVVGLQEIVDVLWGEDPPETCRELIRSYVTRLRRLLEPDRPAGGARTLVHVAGGYRLDPGPGQLDLDAFGDLAARAAQAAAAGLGHAAVKLYAEAWTLRRGPVLAGTPERLRAHPAVAAAARRVLRAALDWADLCLDLDADGSAATVPAEADIPPTGGAHYGEVSGALRAALAEEPLHEGLAARLVLVLAADGQQAAALRLFDTVRARLDDQLGVEPGPELRAAHLRVLRGRGDAPPRTAGRPAAAVPAQLPRDAAAFTGRDTDLEALDRLLPAPRDPAALITVDGMGGIGKTALAVHWGHRVKDRFPDGQLYLDLRGHDARAATRPIEALSAFLGALGVPADRVPEDQEQAAALYRTRLSDKRVLVLLDNAADAAQVRPLLPTGPGSLAVTTGRTRMAGLVAADGAAPVSLGALSPEEAVALLAHMLGPRRCTDRGPVVAKLARLCAHLPLALRIAAANLAVRPGYPIARYVEELASGDRLGALAAQEDADTAVRATFALSCDALAPQERRVFRLLGVIPGPDFTAEAVAALGGTASTGIDAAQRILDRLTARHLVQEPEPGRYALHDLLRLYAAELAAAEEDDPARTAALLRLAGHYRAVTADAAQVLYPHLVHLPAPDAPVVGRTQDRFPDRAAALARLAAEQRGIIAAVTRLTALGHHRAAWGLANLVNGYFLLTVNMVEWQIVARAAAEAADADGDPAARAAAALHLGMVDFAWSRPHCAIAHYRRAADLARQAGWTACHAVAVNNIGACHWSAGEVGETIACLTEALPLHRLAGRTIGEAATISNLAVAYTEWGRHQGEQERRANLDRVGDMIASALALHRAAGDPHTEANTLRILAELRRDAGDLDGALAAAQHAHRLAADIVDLWIELVALSVLATVRVRLGEVEAGLALHEEALARTRETGDPALYVIALLDFGDSQTHLGHTDDALLAAEDALSLLRRIGAGALERRAGRARQAARAARPVGTARTRTQTGGRSGTAPDGEGA